MTKGKAHTQKGRREVAIKKTRRNKIKDWVIGLLGGLALLALLSFVIPTFNSNADATQITVYKSPTCGCCNKWMQHLRRSGFNITTKNRVNMTSIKATAGVTSELESCHTAFVEDYVVEGHVPAEDIKRMLRDRPQVAGITVPGMVMGSPGMEGQRKDAYAVLAFDRDGRTRVYARHK